MFPLFVEHMKTQTDTTYYLAGDNLQRVFPHLLADLYPLQFQTNMMAEKDVSSLGIWIGKAGQITQAHFDCAHNMLTMIQGKKIFTVVPPSDYLNMYSHSFSSCEGNDNNGEMYRYSQVNILNPDLIKFPRFTKVNSIRIELNQGETLLLPLGWWHHVQSFEGQDDINIAVNLFFNASAEHWARKEYKFLKGFRTQYSLE
jgi:hypothetical protein